MGDGAPYSDSAIVGHYINGRASVETDSPRRAVFNPATGEVAREVAMASPAEVCSAVAAARAAFPAGPTLRRSAERAFSTPDLALLNTIAIRSLHDHRGAREGLRGCAG